MELSSFARIFRACLEEQAVALGNAYKSFDTHQIGRGFPERLVTWYYAQALAKALHSGTVLLELPIPKESKEKLDMLVFTDDVFILGENKRDGGDKRITSDIERLRRFAPDVVARFRSNPHPPTGMLFIGFDCYKAHQANDWQRGVGIGASVSCFPIRHFARVFARNDIPAAWWNGAQPNEDGYYLCWALTSSAPTTMTTPHSANGSTAT